MSNKRTIVISVTARPSYSRIKSLISRLNQTELEVKVACSGSALLERYGNVSQLMEHDGIYIDRKIYSVVEGDDPVNMVSTVARTSELLGHYFAELRPDMVLTVADRYETLGCAIAAAYQNIPLIHVQGGELTGNIDDRVRHAISKLSDLHLVACEPAKDRLVKMGENEGSIFNTGCPSVDIAKRALSLSPDSIANKVNATGVGDSIDFESPFFVVLQHPETERHTEAMVQMEATIDAIERVGIQTIFFWPNVDSGSDGVAKGLRIARERGIKVQSRFIKNLPGDEFIKLLDMAAGLIGNSSVGIRESAFLGVPVVNIGCRQDLRDRASNVVDVGWCSNSIMEAILQQQRNGNYSSNLLYGNGDAAEQMASIISGFSFPRIKRSHAQ